MNPYDDDRLVNIYEDRYIHHPYVSNDIEFEIQLIEKTIHRYPDVSWCDVGCGTAYHLRNVKGFVDRTGIDKSQKMMDFDKEKSYHDIERICTDFLSIDTKTKYDIVTNFWLGYTHQSTLEQVMDFLQKMIDITEDGGTIILSVHNHAKLYNHLNLVTPEPMGGLFQFKGIVWSYKEPQYPDLEFDCISPHTDLIRELFEKHFEQIEIHHYPAPMGQYAGRELLLCKKKITTYLG